MSYGFNVYNASGELIVSDSISTMHFLGRASLIGSGTIRASIQWKQWRIGGYAGMPPLPFIRSSGYACVDAVVDVGGGSWDVYTIGNATEVLCFSGLPGLAPAEAYGIQVKSASGQVTFDSGRKPMGVAWVSGVAGMASSYSGASYTIGSLSQPAFFLPSNGVHRQMIWGSNADTYIENVLCAQVSGTQLQMSYLGIHIRTDPHPFEPEPLAPEVYEDAMSPTVIAVIDGANY